MDQAARDGKILDIDDMNARERAGYVMEWENDIIGDIDDINRKIEEIIQNRDIVYIYIYI